MSRASEYNSAQARKGMYGSEPVDMDVEGERRAAAGCEADGESLEGALRYAAFSI
ncbi:MAG: hypothetical protein ABSG21_16460 [Spirochaetia bacterium]|jgi:hypothetical protein